jgi:hypothetical protein
MYYSNNTASSFTNCNVAVGCEALRGSTTPSANTGNFNTAVGYQPIWSNTSGSNNTAAGYQALVNNNTGGGNAAFGKESLYTNSSGNGNTAVGWGADVTSGALTNATAIGYNAKVNASQKVRIGNTTVAVIEGQVAYSYPSDARFKKNVKDDVKGLDFINKLRPVTYTFDTRKFDEFLLKNMPDSVRQARMKDLDYGPSSNIVHTGFMAQEVEKAAKETGFSFDGVNIPENEDQNYGVAYSQFVVPLVKAVQEQQQQIEELKDENKALKAENIIFEERLIALESKLSGSK